MAETVPSCLNALSGLPAVSAGEEPGWVAEIRRRAGAACVDAGLPTSRDEDWKDNPAAKALARDLTLAAPDAAVAWAGELPTIDGAAARLVFVDGRFDSFRSTVGELPAGVRVETLREALRGATDGVPDWMGRVAGFDGRTVAALNTAVPADGALVVLARGAVLADPVHVVFVTTPASEGRMVPLRNLIVAGPGAEGRVLEQHVGPGADTVSNLVTEIVVESGGNLEFVKLVEGSAGVTHLASVDAVVEAQGHLAARSLSTGAANCRTETRVRLTGRGADCDLAMAVLGRDGQVMDQLTRVEHAAPDATSHQLHRAVIDDRARSIFNGLVVVNPGSHGTVGEQSSRSLVLSPDAEAHARPQLDISEDDVRCAHGATIGALEPAALFYLRSRGIDATDASRLLVRGFAMEVVSTIPEGVLRAEAERLLGEWV